MLVKEALQKVPLPLLTEVLRKLVQEQVSIRNMRAILEALVSPTTEGDATALAERCRQALHRYLSHKFAPSGPLFAYLVDPRGGGGAAGQRGLGGPRQRLSGSRRSWRACAASPREGKAVLLTAPDVRRTLRRLIEGAFPEVAVLTYGELDVDLQIRPLGRLAPVPSPHEERIVPLYGSPLTQRKAPGAGDEPQAGSTALQADGAVVTTAPLQVPPAPRSNCTNPNCSMENPEACLTVDGLAERAGGRRGVLQDAAVADDELRRAVGARCEA